MAKWKFHFYHKIEKVGKDGSVLFNIFDFLNDEYYEEKIASRFDEFDYIVPSCQIISLISSLRSEIVTNQKIMNNNINQMHQNLRVEYENKISVLKDYIEKNNKEHESEIDLMKKTFEQEKND